MLNTKMFPSSRTIAELFVFLLHANTILYFYDR